MKTLLTTSMLALALSSGPALTLVLATGPVMAQTEAAPAPAPAPKPAPAPAPAAETATPAAPAAPAAGMDSSASTMTEVTVPEGFVRQDTVLTADDLLGATIYDVTGEAIGDVQDLVIEASTTDAAAGAAPAATDAVPADTMAPADATAPADAMAPDATTADGAVVAPSDAAPVADAAPVKADAISHAVLDVGGFLGMGQHRVAVPVSDLTVYSNDSETRVYLPWSREQIEALQVYDEANPATLGGPADTVAN